MGKFGRFVIQSLVTTVTVLIVIFLLNKIAFTRNFIQMALR